MSRFRDAVDRKCKDCIYDGCAPGNWRVQTTLCSVTSCPLWPLRPKTTGTIPVSTLRWYGIDPVEFRNEGATNAPQVSSSCKGAKSDDPQVMQGKMREGAR